MGGVCGLLTRMAWLARPPPQHNTQYKTDKRQGRAGRVVVKLRLKVSCWKAAVRSSTATVAGCLFSRWYRWFWWLLWREIQLETPQHASRSYGPLRGVYVCICSASACCSICACVLHMHITRGSPGGHLHRHVAVAFYDSRVSPFCPTSLMHEGTLHLFLARHLILSSR